METTQCQHCLLRSLPDEHHVCALWQKLISNTKNDAVMEPNNTESIRQEFYQYFRDPRGNGDDNLESIADWWLTKLSHQREKIRAEIEGLRPDFTKHTDGGGDYLKDYGFNQALDQAKNVPSLKE